MVLIPRPSWSSDVRCREASCCTRSSRETAVGGKTCQANNSKSPAPKWSPALQSVVMVLLLSTSCSVLTPLHPAASPAHLELVSDSQLCLFGWRFPSFGFIFSSKRSVITSQEQCPPPALKYGEEKLRLLAEPVQNCGRFSVWWGIL